MKIRNLFKTFVLVASTLLIFSACGKDDPVIDNNNNNNDVEQPYTAEMLFGSWNITHSEQDVYNSETGDYEHLTDVFAGATYIFDADGTLTSISPDGEDVDVVEWKLNNDTIYIIEQDDIFPASILTLNDKYLKMRVDMKPVTNHDEYILMELEKVKE